MASSVDSTALPILSKMKRMKCNILRLINRRERIMFKPGDLKIDQLPVEILMKIFDLLPTFNEVSLVNKLFYDIVCKVNDSNICLRINKQFLKRFFVNNVTSYKWLKSMQTSTRQISSVEIVGLIDDRILIGDLRRIISVVDKFSATIKIFKFGYATLDESTFVDILSLIPNIDHLYLFQLDLNTYDHLYDKVHRTDDLNLKKLKSLSIICCDNEFVDVFNRLPIGVLSKLNVYGFHWSTLTTVLNRQLNIKELKLGHIYGSAEKTGGLATDTINQLKLESLTLHVDRISNVDVATILSKQLQLKSLNLGGVRFHSFSIVDDQIMNAVADLLELETLEMDASETSVASFANIRKLKNLKELELQIDGDDSAAKLNTLAASDLTLVNSMTLPESFDTSNMGALAKSVPNLKHLKVFRNTFSSAKNEEATIMTHFNFVDVLEIVTGYPSFGNQGNYFNPKLQELTVTVIGNAGIYKFWMNTFVASYPNLKKLKMHVETNFDTSFRLQIGQILNAFTKLESLIISKEDELTVVDLDYLQNYRNKLKFVSFENLATATLTKKITKNFRANFEIVILDDYGNLQMAIGRRTMSCALSTLLFNPTYPW